jgi:hypothetical protein
MTIDINLVNDNPAKPLAIYQGETYRSLKIFRREDMSSWDLYGQIRTNYLSVSDQLLLADFRFDRSIWQPVDLLGDGNLVDRTEIFPVLDYTATLTIPPAARRKLTEAFQPGINCWVYDITARNPTDDRKTIIARGFVEVIAGVTKI